ncbi:Ig-like domain-containing protein [Aneurinibacillus thermoaerophilus]|uniref:Ig-like domain-containing protein n=1 Tax=Aneurinibacillus thermoaerophilus TaxID=143495 RepID=UPI002E1EE277|nr:Ig-like domain-containing protein [Aneurinibacillus thermoaerophilus]MED0761852.1 Ig-like domain-containing protein [Aneurinibacillus thermoaerophilus]
MPEINYFNQNDNTEFQFILNDAGTDVLVNNQPQRVLITNTNLQTHYDDKKISSIELLKCGDLVDYANRKWLIINEVNGLRYDTYKAIMRLCDYNVKFSIDCKVYEFPCIIESSKFSVMADNTMILPNDVIKVTVQENTDTLKVTRDKRFIKFNSAWKVIGIDRTQKGLITFMCQIDQISANDDLVNEIADKCTKTYTIEIINGASSNVDMNGTLQLNVKVTENGAVVTIPVLYESSDTNIATVDTNGLVQGIAEGTVTITARLQEYPDIIDTIQIDVVAIPTDNWSVTITGADSITKSSTSSPKTATYTAQVLNNGVQDTTKTVTWAIVATDETTAYTTIKSQDGTSCVVQSGQNSGKHVTLRATFNDDQTIYAEKVILIKSVF